MKIEAFIEARLRHLEQRIQYNQMNINGIDINRLIREDIRATRKLLEVLKKLEPLTDISGEGPWTLGHINEMWCAIASRWEDHQDFQREWLSS